MAAVAQNAETVTLNDGTSINVARVAGVDDSTWGEMKEYLSSNPDQAKQLQKVAKNPEVIRSILETQAMAQFYNQKLTSDASLQERFKSFEHDPELAPMMEDIKKNGMEALMKYMQDEELMLKFSRKVGGLPEELKPTLQKIQETALTLHEAAKNGDLKSCQEYVSNKKPLDVQDHKGITPLGYAIGANRIAVAKLLLDGRANPFAVDSQGNSGLHYAAGYGRKELCEYLIKVGASVNQRNASGQTPMAVATLNNHAAAREVLQVHGGQA